MDFLSFGVFQDDLVRRSIIVRPPACRGPLFSCPTSPEIDTDDAQAVMVDMERVRLAKILTSV